MAEFQERNSTTTSRMNQSSRDDLARGFSLLGERLSKDAVEFSRDEEGSVLLLATRREGAVLGHDGALVVASPGTVFSDTVSIYSDCTIVGVRFDGQVRIEDSQATVIFIGCVFRYDGENMVVLENLARANFIGCRFGPRASTVAGTVVIVNTAVATRVNLNGCSNKTGLALGTVTQFGVTT